MINQVPLAGAGEGQVAGVAHSGLKSAALHDGYMQTWHPGFYGLEKRKSLKIPYQVSDAWIHIRNFVYTYRWKYAHAFFLSDL